MLKRVVKEGLAVAFCLLALRPFHLVAGGWVLPPSGSHKEICLYQITDSDGGCSFDIREVTVVDSNTAGKAPATKETEIEKCLRKFNTRDQAQKYLEMEITVYGVFKATQKDKVSYKIKQIHASGYEPNKDEELLKSFPTQQTANAYLKKKKADK